MSEHSNQDAQYMWQHQAVEGINLSADQIRQRAGKFENQIRWRNVREYLGAALAALLQGFFFVRSHDIFFRAAFGLLIAGLVWVVIQIRRKGTARSLPSALGASTCVQFFRGELERQRDLVANVWPWYLAPLVPGFVLYTLAYAVAFPHPAQLAGLALLDAIVATVFLYIWKLNRRAARSLQRLIDELPEAENSR
jgi:hypothetical protein